jgi:hypothetical protein
LLNEKLCSMRKILLRRWLEAWLLAVSELVAGADHD